MPPRLKGACVLTIPGSPLRGRAWFPKYQIKTLNGRFSLFDSFDRCNRVRRPTDIARFAGARAHGARRLIGIGTCFEYDLDVRYLSVTTPLKPLTPYAQAKVDTFAALSKLLPERGIEFAWCRLFYLFGEGEDARRLVPLLHAKLGAGEPVELSSGSTIRDYLDVRDAGRMIAEVALGSIQGPVNICSGKPVTVREIAEKIADEYGRRDLLRFGARPDHLDPPCIVGVLEGG